MMPEPRRIELASRDMSEPRDRKVWSEKTERRVTWAVLLVVGALVALFVVAYWRLRG